MRRAVTSPLSPEKAQRRATVMKKTKFGGRTDQRFDKERIDSLNRHLLRL